MKLITHYIFSAGVLSLALAPLSPYHLAVAFVVSLVANTVIDKLGHKEIATAHGVVHSRTPLTHTFPRSIGWGIASAMPLLLFYHSAALLIAGLLVGPTHMILDVFTEKGIFVKKNGKWRRFALAHFRYNDPAVNGLAVVAGLVMLYLSASPSLLHLYSLLSNLQ